MTVEQRCNYCGFEGSTRLISASSSSLPIAQRNARPSDAYIATHQPHVAAYVHQANMNRYLRRLFVDRFLTRAINHLLNSGHFDDDDSAAIDFLVDGISDDEDGEKRDFMMDLDRRVSEVLEGKRPRI